MLIRMQKRAASQFGGQFGGFGGQGGRGGSAKGTADRKEGEVRVETTATDEHKVSKNLGDYVEFEEEK